MPNHLRAVILLIWGIRAGHNSRRIMRVTGPGRIVTPFWWRVFFFSICLSDRRRRHGRVTRSGINCIPPPLRVQSRSQHKQPSYNS
jgi:hypothetical protein